DILTDSLAEELELLGIRFSLGDSVSSRVGHHYVMRGTAEGLSLLAEMGIVEDIDVQTPRDHIHLARDVSIPEINANDTWSLLDSLDRNITGEGLLIADLDSGIDWKHPDFWFADGGEYEWLDDGDTLPTNGTDAIDLDDSGLATNDEVMYYLDYDGDVIFDTASEWIWADSVIQNAEPDIGENFFVVNDTNDNGQLDVGEKLIMLSTPKTKYIVEADGTPSRNIQVWDRSVNLTTTTHDDPDGHGTAVAGILLGGQLGHRKMVGVAPSSELMMIKVIGGSNEWLTIEEGLTWAYNHGADVILIEIGSWTYHYLDGSSASESLIDTIVANGVPVIAPSGNLGGKDKHALFTTSPDTPYYVDFHIPNMEPDIRDVYITVLSVNDTDFAACNFSIVLNLLSWGGSPVNTTYLHPGVGHSIWFLEAPIIVGPNILWIESFISTSSHSTKMLGIHIYSTTSPLPTTLVGVPPFHQINVTSPLTTTFHSYISDASSSWSGGAIWLTDTSDNYEITWPSTADQALSVASYRTRDLVSPETIGDIASFSSRGPRIDEVQKQGVAAPGGFDVVSDYANASPWAAWYDGYGALPFGEQFGSYRLFSGTSASGPHVAGCAALILQASSSAGSDVNEIIKSTAVTDGFTGTVPNPTWGHGKLDVLGAILSVDLTSPVIHTVQYAPSIVEYYHTPLFESNVTDDSGLARVFLKYEVGGWINSTYAEMTQQPSGNFTVSIGPFAFSETVHYSVYANDSAGNDAETLNGSFWVDDNVGPLLSNHWRNATTPGEGHAVAISIDASEPVSAAGLDTVLLNYTTNSWSTFHIVATTNDTGTYRVTIPGQTLGTTVQYFFWANDTEGNINTTSIYSYTPIADESNPPVIGTPIRTPTNVTELVNVTIGVVVTDDTAVATVILSYYNGTAWNNVTMVYNGTHYEGTILQLSAGTEVTFRIYAVDTLGNWAVSDDYTYIVQSSTGTTTPTTPTETTTPLPSNEPDYLLIAMILSAILAFIVIAMLLSRRRSRGS
ncbi:MAG: S8 family serine peptidase, partial [Candidatus Thorarchaeota archaeon]|nr:S8 family serine peptidase [Candidatus Thorarchaeota archaeon]